MASQSLFGQPWFRPYVCKTRSLEAALPWLYLKGVSTGEMENALRKTGGKQRGFNYLAKVIQGVRFKDGEEVTRLDQTTVRAAG